MAWGEEKRTVLHTLRWGSKVLEALSKQANFLDAEVLLAYILGKDRVYLHAHPEKEIDENVLLQFRELIYKRGKGCPVAYLTGQKEFMSLIFNVNTDVLIPRPETETLVEYALEYLKDVPDKNVPGPKIAETCTGSGNIAVSMAKFNCHCHVDAIDISPKALVVARSNAAKHEVAERISFYEGDLFSSLLQPDNKDYYHLVAANPPYIEDANYSMLDKEVLHEPSLALKGGVNGLRFYSSLFEQAYFLLRDGGLLLLEIGDNQGQAVKDMAFSHGGYKEIATICDYAGRDRVIHAIKN